MNDPSEIVGAFIADYCRWNAEAKERYDQARQSDDARIEAIDVAREEYATLLNKYCRPEFRGEPISFGTPSAHDPAFEQIQSTNTRGKRSLIKTRKVLEADPEIGTDFEYRLTHDGGRWYLESVKVVVRGRRYESL